MEPTAAKISLSPLPEPGPLAGLTITLVEDDKPASDAFRLLALTGGARVRRADTLTSARRHVALYRPHVVIVDIGLPDGNGLDLIRDLAGMTAPRLAVVAISGGDPSEWASAAREAGAGAVLAKPIRGVEQLRAAIAEAMPPITDDANNSAI